MTIDVTLLNRFSLKFCDGNEKQDICYCNFYNEFATKAKFMISTDNRVGHLETGFYCHFTRLEKKTVKTPEAVLLQIKIEKKRHDQIKTKNILSSFT